jgi:flagellar motor protein MotB
VSPEVFARDGGRVRAAAGDKNALPADEVGYFLDVLVGRLRQEGGERVTVARRGDRLVLDLTRAVAFEPGRAQPGPGSRDVLARLGRLLAEYRQERIALRVSPVDAASNDDPQLAKQRAFALGQQLAEAGVARKRIVVVWPAARGAATARVVLQLDPVVRAAEPGSR